MLILTDQAKHDLHNLLKLQRSIKRIDATQWDSSIETFLDLLGDFVKKHEPSSYTIRTDENGNPDVSLTWSK